MNYLINHILITFSEDGKKNQHTIPFLNHSIFIAYSYLYTNGLVLFKSGKTP